jgi:hypothetical protein
MRVALAIACLALACLALPSSAAAAKSCRNIVFTPNTEDGIFNITAEGVSCRKARKIARKARPFSITEGPYQYSTRGYDCIGVLDDTSLPFVHWQCYRGKSRNIFFDRG